MSRHDFKSKKYKSQKLIIPKGTVDPNDTTIIEIPSEFRSQDVVIAKKSNQTNYYDTHVDEGVGPSYSDRRIHPSAIQPSYSHDRSYTSSTRVDSRTEISQTVFDERDIERLMADLEAYYQSQKNFLMKTSTAVKNRDDRQNQSNQSMCYCGQVSASPSSAVILVKSGCVQEHPPVAPPTPPPPPPQTPQPVPCYNRQPRNMELNFSTWGTNNNPRMDISGSYCMPDMSMSRTFQQPPPIQQWPQFQQPQQPQPPYQLPSMNLTEHNTTNDSYFQPNASSSLHDPGAFDQSYDISRDSATQYLNISKSSQASSTPKPILKSSNIDDSSFREIRSINDKSNGLLSPDDINQIKEEFKETRTILNTTSNKARQCSAPVCPSKQKIPMCPAKCARNE